MNISRHQVRRWAPILTIAALPVIGIGVAPTTIAQDPCDWDAGSQACLQYQSGVGPCDWDAGSLGCLQAQTGGGGIGYPDTPPAAPGAPPAAPGAGGFQPGDLVIPAGGGPPQVAVAPAPPGAPVITAGGGPPVVPAAPPIG